MKQMYTLLMMVFLCGSFTNAAQLEGKKVNLTPPTFNTNYNSFAFNQFIGVLRSQTIDNTRLAMAINFTQTNRLYAMQIRQIAQTFVYDSYRLTFAKLAFKNCIDPQNYVVLNGVFRYNANFIALMNYARAQYPNNQYGYGNNGGYYNNNGGYYNNSGYYGQNGGYNNYPNYNGNGNCNVPNNVPNYNNPGYYNPNYYNGNNTNQYFDQILNILKDESFDSNRLSSAKNYAAHNRLSATQIREIAETFDFDSNRLDFAKAAYKNCYDKQNYLLLRSAFTFGSNFNELMNYVNAQ